jgi:hypothetical protein
MEMFLSEPELTFAPPTKVASAQLDENPQAWSRQILTELFRQVPESSEYTPQVLLSKVDEAQGYALGVIVIANTTDTALSAVRPSSGARKVLVPVVVKNHMLCPLDLIMTMTGKMLPLNGARLRQALFRPETFELITEDWGDTSLYNMFYPPGRSDNDFGAGISQGADGGTAGAVSMIQGPGMKLSAVGTRFEMLDAIAPTLLAPDLERVPRVVEETPGLFKAACENLVFLAGLQKLAAAEPTAAADATGLYKTAFDAFPTHVIQMGYSSSHDAYWVKTASRDAFYHRKPALLSRGEALKFAGEEVIHKIDTDGTVTVSASDGDASGESVVDSRWSVVETPGIYKVKTIHGKELTGWVLPHLIDLDGTKVPMAVFTNGSQAMVQDQIVGARVGSGVDLPAAPAKGTGVFYCSGPGGVVATVPVLVLGAEGEMSGGDSYLVRSITGGESKVRLVPGLKKIVATGGEFHVPDTAKFLPLDKEGAVALCARVDELSKTSAARLEPKITVYGGDGDEFSLRFEHLPKLASQFPVRQDYETAVFALCLAGCSPKTAHTKLAEASTGGTLSVTGVFDLSLAADIVRETRKTASADSQQVTSLRRYLVKEASTLPDVMTVDAVLSLGFINSENVRMFVSRIPYLEKALSMICEMLLASRLGLNEVPEYAAARATRAVDDTIQGLKALSLREVEEDGTRRH